MALGTNDGLVGRTGSPTPVTLIKVQSKRQGGLAQIGPLQLASFGVHQMVTRHHAAGLKAILFKTDPEATVSQRRHIHGTSRQADDCMLRWRLAGCQRAFLLSSGPVIGAAGTDRLGSKQLLQQQETGQFVGKGHR